MRTVSKSITFTIFTAKLKEKKKNNAGFWSGAEVFKKQAEKGFSAEDVLVLWAQIPLPI